MLILTLLVIFSADLATSSVIRKDGSATEVCDSEECHAAAEHILKWMNTDFKPCLDFFEHTCGYWHTPDGRVLTKKHTNSMGTRGHIANYYLKGILGEEPEGDETPLYGDLRKFLSLCMDEDTINVQGVAPAVRVLEAAGGWPVLQDDWTGDGWDFLEADTLLRGKFLHLLDSFNGDTGTFYLELKIPYSDDVDAFAEGIENEKVQKIYQQLVNIAVAYGAEGPRAEAALQDSIKFEIAMARVIKSQDYSNSENRLYTLRELREEVKWINWTRFFATVLPGIFISEDETIKTNPRLLNLLYEFVLSFPKETVANYVMSYAAASMAEYLPQWVRAIVAENGPEGGAPKNRYDQCVDYLVQKSSLSMIVAAYLAKTTVETAAAAWDLVNELKVEWSKMIEEMDWLDEKSRKEGLDSLARAQPVIGFLPQILDMKLVEYYYQNFKVEASNYLEAGIYDQKRKIIQSFQKTRFPVTSTHWTNTFQNCFGPDAGFEPRLNLIVICAGFLHYIPLFNSKLPLYVKYGQLGNIIGHELTHALDMTANPKGTYRRWDTTLRFASNETEEVYNEKKECIIQQYSSFEDGFTGKKLNGERTQREDIADNGGLKLALRTYRRLAAQLSAPEPQLPQLEQYSPEQLFMISNANGLCHIPELTERLFSLQWDEHTLRDFRVIGMAMNSPDFSELFSCKPGEPMNPPWKCEVW